MLFVNASEKYFNDVQNSPNLWDSDRDTVVGATPTGQAVRGLRFRPKTKIGLELTSSFVLVLRHGEDE